MNDLEVIKNTIIAHKISAKATAKAQTIEKPTNKQAQVYWKGFNKAMQVCINIIVDYNREHEPEPKPTTPKIAFEED
jgi:hypothetical protein